MREEKEQFHNYLVKEEFIHTNNKILEEKKKRNLKKKNM